MAPYKSPPNLGVAIAIDPFTTVFYQKSGTATHPPPSQIGASTG